MHLTARGKSSVGFSLLLVLLETPASVMMNKLSAPGKHIDHRIKGAGHENLPLEMIQLIKYM